MEILKQAPWSRIRGQNNVDKEFSEIVGNGKPTGSVLKGDSCSFRHDMNKRAKSTQPNSSPRSFYAAECQKMYREPRVLEAEAQVGKWLDCRARITSKELAPLHSVRSRILQSACSTSQKWMQIWWKSVLMHTVRLKNVLAKGLKNNGDESAVVMLKSTRQLGCVFQIWSRRSLFSGRAQTCRDQSNVWSSRKLLRVTLKFETKILRSDIFAQVNLISAAPTLHNLRIGLRNRQSGKSKVPAKQRGSWPKVY